MNNIPQVKVGIVAVSRDCFPESLSVNRRKALIDDLHKEVRCYRKFMSAPYVSWRARSTWYRRLKT